MQMNPNNERYWSSRSYYEDDDNDEYFFDLAAWERKKDIEWKKEKDLIDRKAMSIFDKKVIFFNYKDRKNPNTEHHLFSNVLKERESLKCFRFEREEIGLTVNFNSFKEFFNSNKASKISNSFSYIDHLISLNNENKSRYLYFRNVLVSDNYMFFYYDALRQGYESLNLNSMESYWVFSFEGSLIYSKPKILYENFEDVFRCNRFLHSV